MTEQTQYFQKVLDKIVMAVAELSQKTGLNFCVAAPN